MFSSPVNFKHHSEFLLVSVLNLSGEPSVKKTERLLTRKHLIQFPIFKRRLLLSIMANRFTNLLGDDGTCHFYGLLPSTIRTNFAYENALAIQVAIKHLNEGNGIIVPEVEGLNHTCPIQFSASILDTRFSPEYAFEVVDNVTTISRNNNAFLAP